MIAAINYGWTGILGFCVLLLVFKFHRPFEVWLWTWRMKKAGVSQRDIKDLWKREVSKNGQDFIIQLTETTRRSGPKDDPQPEAKADPTPELPQPAPRTRAPRNNTANTPVNNPTTPAKSTVRTTQRARSQQRPKRQPTALPVPEHPRGRHAKPDEDQPQAADVNDGRHYKG